MADDLGALPKLAHGAGAPIPTPNNADCFLIVLVL